MFPKCCLSFCGWSRMVQEIFRWDSPIQKSEEFFSALLAVASVCMNNLVVHFTAKASSCNRNHGPTCVFYLDSETGKRDIWVLNIHECADHIPAPQRTSPFVFECHPRENLHYREVCKNSYVSCLFCMRVYILDPGKRSLVDLVELNLHDDWANSSLWWGPWGAHDGFLKITRVSYLFSATLCALIWLVKTQTGWNVIIKVSSKKAKKPCETLLYP